MKLMLQNLIGVCTSLQHFELPLRTDASDISRRLYQFGTVRACVSRDGMQILQDLIDLYL